MCRTNDLVGATVHTALDLAPANGLRLRVPTMKIPKHTSKFGITDPAMIALLVNLIYFELWVYSNLNDCSPLLGHSV